MSSTIEFLAPEDEAGGAPSLLPLKGGALWPRVTARERAQGSVVRRKVFVQLDDPSGESNCLRLFLKDADASGDRLWLSPGTLEDRRGQQDPARARLFGATSLAAMGRIGDRELVILWPKGEPAAWRAVDLVWLWDAESGGEAWLALDQERLPRQEGQHLYLPLAGRLSQEVAAGAQVAGVWETPPSTTLPVLAGVWLTRVIAAGSKVVTGSKPILEAVAWRKGNNFGSSGD